MSIPVAYALAVIIWSTTPLAIVTSGDSLPPMAAAASRMALAALVGLPLLKMMGLRLPLNRTAFRSYLTAVIGIFGAMGVTYVAAQWIPSGLISVLFGFTTIMTGVLSHFLVPDSSMSGKQWLSCGLGILGLGIVFSDNLVVTGQGVIGVLLALLAVFFFSSSNVLMKRNGAGLHPLQQTVGALWCSLPFYAVAWFATGTEVVISEVSMLSVMSVVYLATLGSLVGFMAYFHLIANLPPAYVALITLITPVIALFLGSQLHNEPVTMEMLLGAGVILTSLLLFLSDNFIRLWQEKKASGPEPKEDEKSGDTDRVEFQAEKA